jgi:hypothetical protein
MQLLAFYGSGRRRQESPSGLLEEAQTQIPCFLVARIHLAQLLYDLIGGSVLLEIVECVHSGGSSLAKFHQFQRQLNEVHATPPAAILLYKIVL